MEKTNDSGAIREEIRKFLMHHNDFTKTSDLIILFNRFFRGPKTGAWKMNDFNKHLNSVLAKIDDPNVLFTFLKDCQTKGIGLTDDYFIGEVVERLAEIVDELPCLENENHRVEIPEWFMRLISLTKIGEEDIWFLGPQITKGESLACALEEKAAEFFEQKNLAVV